MQKAMIKPLVNLNNPLRMLPSTKSEKEFIRGTPGMRNNTDVANACSKVISMPNFIKPPEIREAVKAAK